MTTMINTRSGGKTEARVGDTCRYGGADGFFDLTVTEIWPDANRVCDEHDSYAAELCTLHSRPFAVDDQTEFLGRFIDGTLGPDLEWFPVDWENGDKQKRVQHMNNNPDSYRHIDPDWRSE